MEPNGSHPGLRILARLIAKLILQDADAVSAEPCEPGLEADHQRPEAGPVPDPKAALRTTATTRSGPAEERVCQERET